MMDDAERAYDGGLMRKALGGKVQTKEEKSLLNSLTGVEDEEIKKGMISSNRMPSLR